MQTNMTFRPNPGVDNRDERARWDQLSEWLRVPWAQQWTVQYSGSSVAGTVNDMPSASSTMTFTKLRDDTVMLFHMAGQVRCDAASNSVSFWIRLNSVDQRVGFFYTNTAAAHQAVAGNTLYRNVSAGTYTFKLGWAVVGTARVDSNDYFFLTAEETNDTPST